MKLRVHWAIIDHKHGRDIYMAGTEAELTKQIADYCYEWAGQWDWTEWTPEDDEEVDNPVVKLYDAGQYGAVLETYFERVEDYEWLESGEQEVELTNSDDPNNR